MKIIVLFTIFCISFWSQAQVGINTTNPNAQLDIRSSNQAAPEATDGMLIPKVDTFPAINPTVDQQGMLVYLTTLSGANAPGFYYWNNPTTAWIPIGSNNDSAWNLTGNAGINQTTNFLGTVDSRDLILKTNNTDHFRIKTDGRLEIGNKGIFHTYSNVASSIPKLILASETLDNNIYFQATNNSIDGSSLYFSKSRGNNLNPTKTLLNDEIARIFFHGYNGSQFSSAAQISCIIDETSTGAGVPAMLQFSTTPNGSIGTVPRMTIKSSGLIGIGTVAPQTNLHVVGNIRMVDGNQALGKILVSDANGTASWVNTIGVTNGTLDQAYDFGGTGSGRTIIADNGAVTINGTDGLVSTGILNSGIIAPTGAGVKMFWNPRKAAFRAGSVSGTQWDDFNIGVSSTSFGTNTTSSGSFSTAFGLLNSAKSYGETVFGIGATDYTLSTNGATQFGISNLTDRLLVVGNAIDSNANGTVDVTERSDALVILKNGNTGIGTSTPQETLHVIGKIRMVDGSQGAGKVLTCDANGTAIWNTLSATNAWGLGGNIGTTPTTNFIGTSDNNSVAFRTDNTERARILATGQVGIGTTLPTRKLHITENTISTTNGQLYLEQSGTGDALMHIGNTGARHFNLGLDTSAGNFKIGTSATAATAATTGTLLTIQPTGEVGIGTITPQEKLHVSGPAGLTAIRISNTSTGGATSNVALDFHRGGTANTDWRIYNIGPNLTIGNSNDELATVNDLYQYQGVRFMPMNDATQSLGQGANRWNTLFASNGTINTSDAREKKNIQNLSYGLSTLMQLRPVSFEWNKDDGSGTKLGLIAQDLQQVIPEVVRDWDWEEDEQGNRKKVASPILGVYYSDLIPVLIKATQEQQEIIEQQKEENLELKKQLEIQNEKLTNILKRLEKIEENNN